MELIGTKGSAGAPPNSIGTNGCNTTLTICGTTYTAFGGGRGGNGTAILAFKPVYHPGTVISIH